MEERSINPSESLEIIQNMINKTQRRYSDDSFYYLMWGWLVFVAAIVHFCLMQMNIEEASMVWLLMPVGGVVTGIYSARQSKKEKIKTYVDGYMGYLWISLGIAMVIVLSMMFKLGVTNTYPVLLLIYGIGTFVSGGLINFKPLVIGGVFCFILSAVAFFVTFEIQLLFIAGAMLSSYIIPGHLLKSKFKH